MINHFVSKTIVVGLQIINFLEKNKYNKNSVTEIKEKSKVTVVPTEPHKEFTKQMIKQTETDCLLLDNGTQ